MSNNSFSFGKHRQIQLFAPSLKKKLGRVRISNDNAQVQ
jgi:hypothetical protein